MPIPIGERARFGGLSYYDARGDRRAFTYYRSVATEVTTPALMPERVRSFITAMPPRYATIATINPDGSPHQIVIWFLLRGETLIVNSRHGRRWPSNLRREARASLSVYEGEDAVTLDCDLEREYEGEDAQADIAEMERRYRTPEVAEREVGRYLTQRRLSFVLRPTRVRTHGDPH